MPAPEQQRTRTRKNSTWRSMMTHQLLQWLQNLKEHPYQSIGHDPWDTCFGGGIDDLLLSSRRGGHSHGNGKELLSFESFDERFLVIVVDRDDMGTFGDLVGAVLASYGGDCVLSRGNEIFGEEFANASTSLYRVSYG
ncbi:hypothetical protein HG530_002599 [Fusarium avenaceum]|nr:hypothetical protein HG530_002599 [Fusarium avenaceum]